MTINTYTNIYMLITRNNIMQILFAAVRKSYAGQKHLFGLDVEMKGNRN